MKRRSPFSGELVEAKPVAAGPDLATQIAELRTQLAVEQAKREAAEARCTELQARLTESDQRSERIAADLDRAHGRIEAFASTPAQPAASIQLPDPQRPVAYDGIVTKRDVDGKVHKFEIVPRETVVTRD